MLVDHERKVRSISVEPLYKVTPYGSNSSLIRVHILQQFSFEEGAVHHVHLSPGEVDN